MASYTADHTKGLAIAAPMFVICSYLNLPRQTMPDSFCMHSPSTHPCHQAPSLLTSHPLATSIHSPCPLAHPLHQAPTDRATSSYLQLRLTATTVTYVQLSLFHATQLLHARGFYPFHYSGQALHVLAISSHKKKAEEVGFGLGKKGEQGWPLQKPKKEGSELGRLVLEWPVLEEKRQKILSGRGFVER